MDSAVRLLLISGKQRTKPFAIDDGAAALAEGEKILVGDSTAAKRC